MFCTLATLWLVGFVTEAATAARTTGHHNVIHVIADDLRPEMGCYGLADRHTPNLDALAQGGTVFDLAFAQQAVCGPSRNSFMSGRRPDRSRSWNFINHFREDHPTWTSLPGLFKQNNFLAFGSGKLYHPKLPPAYDGNNSWSDQSLPYRNPCWNTADYVNASFQDGGLPCVFCPVDIESVIKKLNVSATVANEYCEIDAYEDTATVQHAIALLKQLKLLGQPFYLGVGLHKPHMPWQAAPEDWGKHPLNTTDLPKNQVPPNGMPDIAFHFTDDAVHSSPWQPVSPDSVAKARRAYRAAVTGMDRKLGRLMQALDDLGLSNNTAIVFHGDHGWQLGEHGQWRKMTNFEIATRVPLIIKAPWLDQSSAARSASLVELVDLLPTMAELAGVPLPTNETFDGVSLLPLLTQRGAVTKDFVFSQYPRRVTDPAREWHDNSILHHERSTFTHMGYSVRTREWRYTEWVGWNQSSLLPIWTDPPHAAELYDYRGLPAYPTDFDASDNVNRAGDPSLASVQQNLSKLVRDNFPFK